MPGKTNLQAVLNSMQIDCDDVEYGFANVPDGTAVKINDVAGTFSESEGLTIIASLDYLKSNNFGFEGPFAKLTIDIPTSLELVGLTAVLAAKLANNDISANVVAAYFHDHVFVQYELRESAINALTSLRV